MYLNCAFSGHRYGSDFSQTLLDRIILNLIKSGTQNFYCGMAQGFDLTAAESVISLKKDYPIKLFACIPCAEQSDSFSRADKIRYERILENCDGKIVLSPSYFKGCMHLRDRFLIDNCNVLVCFLRRKSGGTYYTVNYAKKCGVPVIEL